MFTHSLNQPYSWTLKKKKTDSIINRHHSNINCDCENRQAQQHLFKTDCFMVNSVATVDYFLENIQLCLTAKSHPAGAELLPRVPVQYPVQPC